MPPTDQRLFRWAAALLLLCGCEAIGGAYNCGYDAGYDAADALLDEGDRRNASVAAWQAACATHSGLDATTQQAGDDECDQRRGFGSRLTPCDDPGENRDVLPPGCDPFEDSGFGNDGLGCPAGVTGFCLCCDRDGQACALAGDFCLSDDSCCSGICVLQDPVDAGTSGDAGPSAAPRGSCR